MADTDEELGRLFEDVRLAVPGAIMSYTARSGYRELRTVALTASVSAPRA